MFSSRKGLAIVLTVVCLLAMVAPAAMAAPEWVHGVTITAPTTQVWVAVNPEVDGAGITVSYDVDIVGTQVDNVWIRVMLLQKYVPDPGNVVLKADFLKLANEFVPGTNSFGETFLINDSVAPYGELWDGWYDLKVCAMDIDPDRYLFCTTQANAVLVQDSYPTVDLEKPGVEPYEWMYWQKATIVTGQDYLMVGYADDEFGIIKNVEFQYCDESNFPGCPWWDKESPSWITIASLTEPDPAKLIVPVTRFDNTNQYQATWDSSQVPDDFSWIRMCAWNAVGLSNCEYGADPEDATRADAHRVFVNNRSVIHLEPGWNLISTPIIPYAVNGNAAGAIEDVLFHLIMHNSVRDVWSYQWNGTQNVWKSWTADPLVPDDLDKIEDGKGYWIFMNMEDDLTVVGTWKVIGNNAPPQYPVFYGPNLIGYTHFGRPTLWPTKVRADYLGPAVEPYTQVLYLWDAEQEVYRAVYSGQHMTLGAGYWLATIQDGTIAP